MSAPASGDFGSLLQHGWSLMRERQWACAHDMFRQATQIDERAAGAWEAFAAASMCVDDFDAARQALEQAYREAQRAGDCRTAARAATQLAVYHDGFRGESAIANGWFERARALLAGSGPVPEHAWLALWEAHIDIHVRGDVAEGQRKLEEAVRINQTCRAGDDLELLARGSSASRRSVTARWTTGSDASMK